MLHVVGIVIYLPEAGGALEGEPAKVTLGPRVIGRAKIVVGTDDPAQRLHVDPERLAGAVLDQRAEAGGHEDAIGPLRVADVHAQAIVERGNTCGALVLLLSLVLVVGIHGLLLQNQHSKSLKAAGRPRGGQAAASGLMSRPKRGEGGKGRSWRRGITRPARSKRRAAQEGWGHRQQAKRTLAQAGGDGLSLPA